MTSDHDSRPTGLAVPIRIPATLARVRRRWDRSARAGAGAHVTILYPFVRSDALTPDVRSELARVASTVTPFSVRFRIVRRFDEGVVWVEPEPDAPFRRLTGAVVDRWPDHPPYDGLFDEVITHLTIVESDGDDPPLLDIEALARRTVPFEARAERLELWRMDDAGRWRTCWRLPLGIARLRR